MFQSEDTRPEQRFGQLPGTKAVPQFATLKIQIEKYQQGIN